MNASSSPHNSRVQHAFTRIAEGCGCEEAQQLIADMDTGRIDPQKANIVVL